MTNVPELDEGPALTEHVAMAPVPARVQLSTVVKVTCPVGVIAVPAVDESVTVAVHDVVCPTAIVFGVQLTAVVVVRRFTVTVAETVLLLPACAGFAESPP